VAGGWRRLCNEEIHNLYNSNIIRVIKSWRMMWMGHAAFMGKMGNTCKMLSKYLKGRDYSEDLGVDGKVVLEWILRK
jgi:hypothetical protein